MTKKLSRWAVFCEVCKINIWHLTAGSWAELMPSHLIILLYNWLHTTLAQSIHSSSTRKSLTLAFFFQKEAFIGEYLKEEFFLT